MSKRLPSAVLALVLLISAGACRASVTGTLESHFVTGAPAGGYDDAPASITATTLTDLYLVNSGADDYTGDDALDFTFYNEIMYMDQSDTVYHDYVLGSGHSDIELAPYDSTDEYQTTTCTYDMDAGGWDFRGIAMAWPTGYSDARLGAEECFTATYVGYE